MNPYRKEQREQEKKIWKSLSAKQKLRQASDYYRLPLFLVFLVICAAGYAFYLHATRTETVLYAALVNLRPDEEVTGILSDGFIPYYEEVTGKTSAKNSVFLYVDLHLSDTDSGDYNQQEYSSLLRLMSAVQSRQLDVVLMDQQAFHTLSQDGYLADLNSCLAEYPGLLALLSLFLPTARLFPEIVQTIALLRFHPLFPVILRHPRIPPLFPAILRHPQIPPLIPAILCHPQIHPLFPAILRHPQIPPLIPAAPHNLQIFPHWPSMSPGLPCFRMQNMREIFT